jgi:5-methyltetrahydrofolate--homocysteine methyltransferase
LNINSPEVVSEVHKAYFQAGSDAVLTNTFGGNEIALKRHELDSKADDINKSAAELAQKAGSDDKYVLGDIGPSGDFLKPLGTLTEQQLIDAFGKQAQSLDEGGVDGFIIETMTAVEEVIAAIKAIRSVNTEKPLFVSMAFDSGNGEFRTMMGQDCESIINKISKYKVDVAGFNCGKMTLENYIEFSRSYVQNIKESDLNCEVMAELNAGIPELVDGEPQYNVQPDEFAQAAQKVHDNGVKILGGCCGTTPEHIKAMVENFA